MDGLAGAALDLIVPDNCAGCRGAARSADAGICPRCRAELAGCQVAQACPRPMPAAFPATLAAGQYGGVLRELLLAYKERGRHRLAKPLGERLAAVVYAGLLTLDCPAGTPIAVVPVPDTPGAARARYGDHLRRLADRVAKTLSAAGYPTGIWPAVVARSGVDSAALDSAGRAAAAGKFALRSRVARPVAGPIVLLDDIVTTGATLARISALLSGAGYPVDLAAVLAATARRRR